MLHLQFLQTALLALSGATFAFPSHMSLAGLTREQLDLIIPTLNFTPPLPPPAPLNDTSAKLVNDPAHPWQPLRPGDIRGVCPGLNTLASHGVRQKLHRYIYINSSFIKKYLPRTGIVTANQIIEAAQEGTS